jgi:N-acetylmuramoyl-L-alanine amidase
MKYSTLKRIGRIALIGSILYFLSTKDLIAPEYKQIAIESGKPLIARKVVVIDIGHGKGNKKLGVMDFGKVYKEYIEADIVSEQARIIKKMLNPSYYKVILTRENNEQDIPLESRPKLANELNANLFISLHINDKPKQKDSWGFEVYYRENENKELENENKEFAELTANNLETMTSISKRWVKKKKYLMLKGLECPGILIESAHIRSKKDMEEVYNPSFPIEKAVTKSIEDYLK